MSHRSAIKDNGARLDIAVHGFWGGRFEKAFLDVRVFNPCARSNQQVSLASVYRRHEQEKKRQYKQRIREVEHSTFTPWLCQLLEEWVGRLLHSTRDLRPC